MKLLGLVVMMMACGGTSARVAIDREEILALREVSGLAIGTVDGRQVIAAIGDEDYAVTLVPLVAGLPDTPNATTIDVPLPKQTGGSQLEGVAIADGHVWLLAEGAATLSEVEVADGKARILRSGALTFAPDHPLATAWHADPNHGGEGLVVDGARVLVAKQQDPTVIVAFTWQGDRWVGTTTWQVAMDDISDLARGPDGALYAIGARAGKICRFGPLPDGGGALACVRSWVMPAALGKGKTQWEGLTFLPDGRPLVAVDRKKHESPNLAVLPVLEGTP